LNRATRVGSPDKTRKAFEGLYEKLCGLHPELIGEPEGLTMEDEVLIFKGCEVFTWQQDDF